MFADIDRDLLKAGKVVFSVVDRKGNEMAASLVIAGFNRENMFKVWWIHGLVNVAVQMDTSWRAKSWSST